MSQHLTRIWKSIPIPKLNRRSVLSIERSNDNGKNLKKLLLEIHPEIREDGNLTLTQSFPRCSNDNIKKLYSEMDLKITKEVFDNTEEKVTSYNIKLDEKESEKMLFNDLKQLESKKAQLENVYGFVNRKESASNNAAIPEDHPYSHSAVEYAIEEEKKDEIVDNDDNDDDQEKEDNAYELHLTARIPYFANLHTNLYNTDIIVKDDAHKLECLDDIDLRTSQGNISVNSKIISFNINLQTKNGYIFIKKKLEGKNINISATNGRIRAKLIHGGASDTSLTVDNEGNNLPLQFYNLDDDDDGALIDISSLYSSYNSASSSSSTQDLFQNTKISVISNQTTQNVRIKSNHGHVFVNHLMRSKSATKREEDKTKEKPSIQLNSVNGSFNITTQSSELVEDNNQLLLPIAIHVDSLSSNSQSSISNELWGKTHLTIDEKISCTSKILSCHDLVSHQQQFANAMLKDSEENFISNILIKQLKMTKAVYENNNYSMIQLVNESSFFEQKYCLEDEKNNQYVSGIIQSSNNKDSNHDLISKSIGKINVEAAASSALNLFSSNSSTSETSHELLLPCIVVCNRDYAIVERLTWMDIIRNKFGVEKR